MPNEHLNIIHESAWNIDWKQAKIPCKCHQKPSNNGGAELGELDDQDDGGQGRKWKESRQSL